MKLPEVGRPMAVPDEVEGGVGFVPFDGCPGS